MKKEKKGTNRLLLLWYAHPRIAVLISLVVINLFVIFLFTAILSLVSQNNFFSELAYIFTYTMCSDGIYDFVNSNEDLACFAIKLVLTVVQMIIFSGALIGFSTDFLQNTIDKSLNNIGKINLRNHYVFLNWSSIGPQVVYDLSFLEGEKNIVILSDENRDVVLNSIHNIFVENNRKLKKIRIFVKEGSPKSVKHLEDVSICKAKYVGIFLTKNNNDETGIMPPNDLEALKTLLNIISLATKANIVLETENEASVSKIESLLDEIDPLLKKRVIAFSHNGVISNVLGKSIFNSNYSGLYHHLLSYDGVEFYGIEPKDIKEALYLYNDCIPIINYDDDDEVDEFGNKNVEQLYILSDTKQSLGLRKEKLQIERKIPIELNKKIEPFTLFILSNTNSPAYVIEEIKRYEKDNNVSINIFNHHYNDDFDNIVKEIHSTKGKKKILLLSAINENIESQDTNIFLSALSLKLEGCLDESLEILAEIVNPSNYNSLKNIGVMSVIMSNKIISLFMVQVLTHPGSKKFYRDIISTNDCANSDSIDIELIKAEQVIKFMSDSITFDTKAELVQSFYLSSNEKMMCIGYIKNGGTQFNFLCDKMDENESITINKDDELIIVTY